MTPLPTNPCTQPGVEQGDPRNPPGMEPPRKPTLLERIVSSPPPVKVEGVTMASSTGPTGISPAAKYVALAVLTILGAFLGYLEGQPAITDATLIAAVVYVIPTIVSEFEGA